MRYIILLYGLLALLLISCNDDVLTGETDDDTTYTAGEGLEYPANCNSTCYFPTGTIVSEEEWNCCYNGWLKTKQVEDIERVN